MDKRDVKVVVADVNCEETDYDDYNITLNQKAISLDELFDEIWFLELLREKGYYNKEKLGESNEYLNNFVYEYKPYQNSYSRFTNSLKEIQSWYSLIGVFQEITGTKRIKELGKWKQKREEYLKKEAEKLAKVTEATKQKKEKARLRQIEKAKKLLSEEGMIK